MSLDVYLEMPGTVQKIEAGRIFVRKDGATKEISREEWDRENPDREPVVLAEGYETNTVYTANITHNLGDMARAADIYLPLWHPDEAGLTKAKELIQPLKDGLELLEADPEKFKVLNPDNGWGNYEGLVAFVRDYILACERYPDADVRTWT